jgi:enoyl-CoA hydratase/carnithine racemase
VLVAEFHSTGGPFRFTSRDHTEFVEAFYRIGQDRENKIVVLTGAGGEFIPEIDFSSFGNVADPGVWSQVHDEGALGERIGSSGNAAKAEATVTGRPELERSVLVSNT